MLPKPKNREGSLPAPLILSLKSGWPPSHTAAFPDPLSAPHLPTPIKQTSACPCRGHTGFLPGSPRSLAKWERRGKVPSGERACPFKPLPQKGASCLGRILVLWHHADCRATLTFTLRRPLQASASAQGDPARWPGPGTRGGQAQVHAVARGRLGQGISEMSPPKHLLSRACPRLWVKPGFNP